MDYQFRKAEQRDAKIIWKILQQAIQKRKEEGSNQWQDGYPNPDVIASDISNGIGFVLLADEQIAGYTAIDVNNEPAYDELEGTWLTNGDFVVFHRAAISKDFVGRGLANLLFECIENYASENGIYSVKADTNFDNDPMLHLFKKLGYTYCGEVYFRGAPRKAYEKILNKTQ
jgi:GNAT superfamily N-acetyltransferase